MFFQVSRRRVGCSYHWRKGGWPCQGILFELFIWRHRVVLLHYIKSRNTRWHISNLKSSHRWFLLWSLLLATSVDSQLLNQTSSLFEITKPVLAWLFASDFIYNRCTTALSSEQGPVPIICLCIPPESRTRTFNGRMQENPNSASYNSPYVYWDKNCR